MKAVDGASNSISLPNLGMTRSVAGNIAANEERTSLLEASQSS